VGVGVGDKDPRLYKVSVSVGVWVWVWVNIHEGVGCSCTCWAPTSVLHPTKIDGDAALLMCAWVRTRWSHSWHSLKEEASFTSKTRMLAPILPAKALGHRSAYVSLPLVSKTKSSTTKGGGRRGEREVVAFVREADEGRGGGGGGGRWR
jgi:hypothetical protein